MIEIVYNVIGNAILAILYKKKKTLVFAYSVSKYIKIHHVSVTSVASV